MKIRDECLLYRVEARQDQELEVAPLHGDFYVRALDRRHEAACRRSKPFGAGLLTHNAGP